MNPSVRFHLLRFRSLLSSPVHFSGPLLFLIGAYFCFAVALWAQNPDSQAGDANQSWTTSTESQNVGSTPTRTIERHTQSGNRTLDTRSLQSRGLDGRLTPYQDIETETVQVDAATVRTSTRTFGRDANGARTLVQVTEEEKHILPGGNSNVVRSTSNPDADGKLQLVQREIEETKKTGENVEETKKTVMLPSINGGLAPVMKVQERRTRGANDTVDSQTTTLLPDGAGNWQVGEIRKATQQGGKNPSLEERISRPDAEGNLSEISRTVSKQVENSSGEKRNTVETYSVDVPGTTRDGGLHLVERATTVQHISPTGQQTTQQQVEQPNPGDPGAGLRVTVISTNAVRPGASEVQGTQTIQMRDANGNFGTVSVDISKSTNIHAVQVQIAPSEKPK
jgi:hypothetical protein